jgi:hypothetical protein
MQMLVHGWNQSTCEGAPVFATPPVEGYTPHDSEAMELAISVCSDCY